MNKHTPGPWEICKDQDFHNEFEKHISLPNGDITINGEGEELEANARLIASAPVLLASLKTIMPYLKALELEIGAPQDEIFKCEQAISKAEGAL